MVETFSQDKIWLYSMKWLQLIGKVNPEENAVLTKGDTREITITTLKDHHFYILHYRINNKRHASTVFVPYDYVTGELTNEHVLLKDKKYLDIVESMWQGAIKNKPLPDKEATKIKTVTKPENKEKNQRRKKRKRKNK